MLQGCFRGSADSVVANQTNSSLRFVVRRWYVYDVWLKKMWTQGPNMDDWCTVYTTWFHLWLKTGTIFLGGSPSHHLQKFPLLAPKIPTFPAPRSELLKLAVRVMIIQVRGGYRWRWCLVGHFESWMCLRWFLSFYYGKIASWEICCFFKTSFLACYANVRRERSFHFWDEHRWVQNGEHEEIPPKGPTGSSMLTSGSLTLKLWEEGLLPVLDDVFQFVAPKMLMRGFFSI